MIRESAIRNRVPNLELQYMMGQNEHPSYPRPPRFPRNRRVWFVRMMTTVRDRRQASDGSDESTYFTPRPLTLEYPPGDARGQQGEAVQLFQQPTADTPRGSKGGWDPYQEYGYPSSQSRVPTPDFLKPGYQDPFDNSQSDGSNELTGQAPHCKLFTDPWN